MSDLYLRKVMVMGSGVSINTDGDGSRDLMVEFDVLKGQSSVPNEATIKIYNLSESQRNSLGKELDDITLVGGYLNANQGIIFKGNIRDIEHTREGPDIISTLKAGDGDKVVRNSTIAKSYEKNTKPSKVIQDILDAMGKEGASQGQMKLPDNMPDFKRPYAAIGSCKRELDLLGRSFGFYWSIQNGSTEIVAGDSNLGGSITIDAYSGMINVPTITDDGVKVAVMLNPAIAPNLQLTIKSQVLEMNSAGGEYTITGCRYYGNNRTGVMAVHIEGKSMQGGKASEGKKNETVENTIAPELLKKGAV